MLELQPFLNTIYAPLCDLRSVQQQFSDVVRFEAVCSELDGPFLIKSNPAYENSERRVVIVGQENNRWYGFSYLEFLKTKSMEDALRGYDAFKYEQSYQQSVFFQWFAKLADALVPHYRANPKQVIWSNLFKFNQGLDPQMIYSQFEADALRLQGDTFTRELEILKPNAVVFLTGPYYDRILEKFFPGIEQVQIADHPKGQLARLKHDKLPEDTFRTYHPGYLQRSPGKTGYCIPTIVKLITGAELTDQQNRITIDRIDAGTGWVVFQAGDSPPIPDQLPFFLNDAFSKWLRNNPEFRVRCVLPIESKGNTVAINVWFD